MITVRRRIALQLRHHETVLEAPYVPGCPVSAYAPQQLADRAADDPLRPYGCFRNGDPIPPELLDVVEPDDGDELMFVAEQHFVGVTLTAVLWAIAKIIIIAAISYGISALITLLLAPGAMKKGAKAVSAFSGLSNKTRRGDTIPVLVGEHRAVPRLVSFYTEIGEDGSNVFRGLYALSLGRVDSIGGETEEFDRWTRDSKRVPIGAVAGGTFVKNANFTATPSGATGRVLRPAVDGDAYLYYVPTGGDVADGDTITANGFAITATVAGDVEENAVIDAFKINGNPLRSYKGVRVSFRPGEMNQSPIPGWNLVHNVVPVGVTLDQAKDGDGIPVDGRDSVGDWYDYETTQPVDRVRLVWQHPGGLYKSTPSSGGQNPYRVYYHLRFRAVDAESGDPGPWYYMVYDRTLGTYSWSLTETDKRAFMLERNQGSPFASGFDVEFFDENRVPFGRGDFHIGAARYNGGWYNFPGAIGSDPELEFIDDQVGVHEPPGRVSAITLEAVDEITEESLAYPGVALIDVAIQATDQLNADPLITVETKGVRCPVWDGVDTENPTFAWQWSNNPAWVALMFTLHKTIGIGGDIDVRDIDLPSFLAVAEHSDQMVDDGAGGQEKLATYDNYLEDEIEYWDLMQQVGAVARFQPVEVGSKLRLRLEKPRERVQVFGMGNICAGTFTRTFLDPSKAENQVIVGIRNRELNYDPDTAIDEDDDADGPLISTTMDLPGITRMGHGRREAKLRRLLGQSLTDQIEFEVNLDAIALEVGDRFGLNHDVPAWGFSGLVGAGSSLTTVVLDRDVELEHGKTYECLVRHPDDIQETRQIVSPPGLYEVGDEIEVGAPWSKVPGRHCVYAVGPENSVVRDWNCVRIERGEALRAKVTAVNYESAPLTESLVLSDHGVQVPFPVYAFEHAIPSDVVSPRAVAQHQVQIDGTVREGIAVSWVPAEASSANRVEVFSRESGTTAWTSAGRTSASEYFVSGTLEVGKIYEVAVAGVAISGQTRQHPDDAPRAEVLYDPKPARPVAPASASAKRSGNLLALSWTPPSADEDGVPRNRQVGRYEIRRGDDWRTAVPLLSMRGQAAELRDWVHGREQLLIRAVDTHEQESPAGAWIATDQAPATNYAVVLDRDERAGGWPETPINASVNAAGRLELDAGESVGYYLIPEIDLGRESSWRVAVVAHLRQEPLHWTGEASRVEVGSVTDGPFERYETVTGGTSAATARVLRQCTEGDLYLYLLPLTGTFTAGETLTGGTSGATTTLRAGPWALLLSDPVWEERDFGGYHDEDVLTDSGTTNRTSVNVRVTRLDGSSTLLVGGQGTVTGRYLEVEVILASDDPANFTVVCAELRIIASEQSARVEGLLTAEVDTGKSLRPDGAGGVTWV